VKELKFGVNLVHHLGRHPGPRAGVTKNERHCRDTFTRSKKPGSTKLGGMRMILRGVLASGRNLVFALGLPTPF
jgi:hypothetical protein